MKVVHFSYTNKNYYKDEKTAIITGSSRGLGAKIAITLLEKATMLLLITNKIRIKLKN